MLYIDALLSISKEELSDNYPEVFRALSFYYLLGFSDESEQYNTASGALLIQKLLKEKEQNIEFWRNEFCDDLGKAVGLLVKDTTLGIVPSYGAKIIIEQDRAEHLSIELHINLSLLSNFYSIQIAYVNSKKVMRHEFDYLDDIVGHGLEKLIVSPVNKFYGELFELVEKKISKLFTNAKFLPYNIDRLRLDGLTVHYNEMGNSPIGMAFFHNFMPINYYRPPELLGDSNYKINKLKK